MEILAETVPDAVGLALAKSHLKITHANEDLLVRSYIASATRMVEAFSGVRLVRREIRARWLRWHPAQLLPGPVQNVLETTAQWSGRPTEVAGAVSWDAAGRILWDNYAVAPYEVRWEAGLVDDARTLPPHVQAAVLSALGHFYIYREGQPFGEGLMAQIRTIKGIKF